MSDSKETILIRDYIAGRFYKVIHQRQADNYDADRFSIGGVDHSEDFDVSLHGQALCFFFAHCPELVQAFMLLKDDASRNLFLELILFRLAGHLHVKLPTNNPRRRELYTTATTLPSTPSRFANQSAFGPLRHFEAVPFNGMNLSADCWPGNIAYSFFIKQYFLDREGISIQPEKGDFIIDGGACFGDTALSFAAVVGPEGRVYSFDPLAAHGEIIKYNLSQNPSFEEIVTLFPHAIGEQGNDLPGPLAAGDQLQPGFTGTAPGMGDILPTRTIDGMVDAGSIERVDFIKMDIEGYELAALRGAEKTLCKFKPRLAISIYHNFRDFYEIPMYLDSLGIGYRLYLDHYTIHQEETVLYAVAD